MSPAYLKSPVASKIMVSPPDRKADQQMQAQRQFATAHRQNRAHLAADQAPVRGAQPRLQTR